LYRRKTVASFAAIFAAIAWRRIVLKVDKKSRLPAISKKEK